MLECIKSGSYVLTGTVIYGNTMSEADLVTNANTRDTMKVVMNSGGR